MTKQKAAKQSREGARSFTIPALPPEGVVLPAQGMLKRVRERVGLTQVSLAKECGLSPNVIVNYESGRTKLESVEDALRVWRLLEAKERALGSTEQKKGPSAAQAVLGLLWLAKLNAQRSLSEIDGQIENLQRTREGAKQQIAQIEAEETDRVSKRGEADPNA